MSNQDATLDWGIKNGCNNIKYTILYFIFWKQCWSCELVKSINSEDELFVLLDNYNWDNGFEGRIKDFFKVDDAELGNTWYHH